MSGNLNYTIRAYDADNNELDITGQTPGEILSSNANIIRLANDDYATKTVEMVGRIRVGVAHNWDTDTHMETPVAYFLLRMSNAAGFGGEAIEAYLTENGLNSKVAGTDEFPSGGFNVTAVRADGTLDYLYWA